MIQQEQKVCVMPDYKPSTCTLLLELLSGEGTVLETKALTALLLSFS